jgi:hypothetical protein
MEELGLWEAHVFISCFGAAFIGAIFLLAGSITYLISRLKP